jgi:hypothetical protein
MQTLRQVLLYLILFGVWLPSTACSQTQYLEASGGVDKLQSINYTAGEQDLSRFRKTYSFVDPLAGSTTSVGSGGGQLGPAPKTSSKPIHAKVSYDLGAAAETHWANYRQRNQTLGRAPGWRVQIFSATDPDEAKQVMFEAANQFGEFGVYQDYKQPYFRIRVGDHTNRVAAYQLCYTLRSTFPNAFVVTDEVRILK